MRGTSSRKARSARVPHTQRSSTSWLGLANRTVTGTASSSPDDAERKGDSEVRRATAARLPSTRLTRTSLRSEPDFLIRRQEERAYFWDAVFCNRPGSAAEPEDRSRRSGDGPGIEPAKMFGAARPWSCSLSVETVSAAVRTVKLSTSYLFGGEILPRSRCALLTGEAIKRFGSLDASGTILRV